jgi:putative cardiolipin synthase
VSPYFVPTAAGVHALSTLSEDGVAVRVLTNSPEATDVSAVHAGCAKRRKALLKAGIRLYALRRSANAAAGRFLAGLDVSAFSGLFLESAASAVGK